MKQLTPLETWQYLEARPDALFLDSASLRMTRWCRGNTGVQPSATAARASGASAAVAPGSRWRAIRR
jgi:hypothetical protein